MKKIVDYFPVRFPVEVLKEAKELLASLMGEENGKTLSYDVLTVNLSEASWYYDTYEQFAAGYRINYRSARFEAHSITHSLFVDVNGAKTSVFVKAPDLQTIENVFDVFERNRESSKVQAPPDPKPVIFIGHGRNKQWVDLKMHL